MTGGGREGGTLDKAVHRFVQPFPITLWSNDVYLVATYCHQSRDDQNAGRLQFPVVGWQAHSKKQTGKLNTRHIE